VTITPYGKEIEPNVPDKGEVMEAFKLLSKKVGINAVGWRYDPIFITEKYSMDFHIDSFEAMSKNLSGYVDNCVISFIDLYAKTKRNFPDAKAVTKDQRERIASEFVRIGNKYGIKIRTCCEGKELAKFGVDVDGCMTKNVMERAMGVNIDVPKRKKSPREDCNCLLGNDIGVYNTCGHGCVYCYANYNMETVHQKMRNHTPKSPFLIGNGMEGDTIKDAKQETYVNGQLSFL
jgi:DNA repair photolyase